MNSAKAAKRIMDIMRPSVFEEFNMVCNKAKSLNMAQGFPDWDTPKFLKDSLIEVMSMNEDQYARAYGHIPLTKAIATEYSEKFGREINSMTEISIGNGATGVLSNIMCSFLEHDDEIIMFEPAFEFYFRQAEIFEGRVKFIPLTPPGPNSDEWGYDFDAIEKVIGNKTRILLLNTPHNPTGKVLTKKEVDRFVEIAKKWPNLIVVSDEVYENMTMDNRKHIRIGSYPEMWDRTISVYSLGKTFSCTGWRAGFAVGPENLIKPLNAAQNWLTFCISRPIQVAFAKAMEISAKPYDGSKTYYEHLNKYFNTRRDRTVKILKSAPINYRVFVPDGGYFAIADVKDAVGSIPAKYFYKEGTSDITSPAGDWRKLKSPDYPADSAFCRYMSYEWGVTPLPLSPLYNNNRAESPTKWRGTDFIRFALCKNDQTLDKLESLLCKSKSM